MMPLRILIYQIYFTTISVFSLLQAEDGIRDGHVTGVQTCALPISPDDALARPRTGSGRARRRPSPAPARSEERRVGKECSSQGTPTNYKEENRPKSNQCWMR